MNAATAVPTASIGLDPEERALRYALCAWGSLLCATLKANASDAQRRSLLIPTAAAYSRSFAPAVSASSS
jgi:hypothetical protein